MKKISLLFLTILCFSLTIEAQNEALFDNATAAYNEGKYKEAIGFYDSIIANGEHSAALYFNLGNAYYKLNEIASSIYYYEKALLLKPNDPEIKNNLGYAQNMTLDAIDTMPKTGLSKIYKSVTGQLSFDQWGYMAVGFMVLFTLLYILFYYAQYSSQKRWAFIGSLVSLAIAIISVVFAFIQYNDFTLDDPAIIFADEVAITSEPNPTSQEVFTLHSGTKVNVLEELNQWKKIRLADGKTGWISSEHLRLLKDF